MQYLAIYGNWTYEYIGYDKSWNDMLEMLRNGEIDLISNIQKTPEREVDFLFSEEPIAYSSAILTTKQQNHANFETEYADWPSITIGMIDGSIRNKEDRKSVV